MPKIPDYSSQVRVTDSAGTVPVPTGSAVLPFEAQSKAFGVGAKYAAEVGSLIDQAEASSQVAAASADASIKLNDLRNQFLDSPEFNLNPSSMRGKYEEEVRKLGDQIQSSIKGSIGQEFFRDQFDKLAAHHTVQFSNDIRKGQVNLTQAGYLQALDRYSRAAASAPDEGLFRQNMKGLAVSKAGMIASGAYSADQAETIYQTAQRNAVKGRAELGLVSNPAQLLRDLSDPEGKYKDLHADARASLMINAEHRMKYLENKDNDLLVTRATELVFNQFGLGGPNPDLQGALAFAGNPNNLAALGLTETKQLASVQNFIATEYNRQELARNKVEKQKAEVFSQGAINKFVEGKLGVSEITRADIPSETKQHWINAIGTQARREEKPNPELYSKLLADVWNGNITETQQIIPHMGPGGISATQARSLDEARKQAQEPTKSQYFRMSIDLYKAKHKGDDEMLKLLPEFQSNLDWHIKGENLKGPEIYDRAKQLMTPLEENRWWKFWQSDEAITPPFQRELEEQPWRTMPPSGGRVRGVVPQPGQIDPRIQERIDKLRGEGVSDADMAAEFKQYGIDPKLYGLPE